MPFHTIFLYFFQLSRDIEEKVGDDGNIEWAVTCSSGLSSVSLRLHTQQPMTLDVDIRDVVSTPVLKQFFQAIQKEFTGDLNLGLWKSYMDYDQCDKSIVVIPDFKYVMLFVNNFL